MISDLKHGLFKYDVKDYYAILGVPISASPKDVRLRYLKIAYQLHPDTNRAETEAEKQKASMILSKLVNPAYENLYKDNLRKECQLIFSEIGRRLASDQYKITIGSDTAKKLLQEERNLDKVYLETLEKLAPEQYHDLDKLSIKIALISELNMVYLMRQKNPNFKSASSQPQIVVSEAGISQSSGKNVPVMNTNNPPVSDNPPPKATVSRIDKLIASAKQHLENGNYEQGILDLREAVKIDASSSTVHALLGSLYMKQNNLVYARIHINKAIALNSNDSIALQAQKELKEIEKKEKSAPESTVKSTKEVKGSKPTDKGKEKSKDGKGKKEPPKIFGIPLW
ncbi:hypothetical protein GM3709_56 [Geminocystis sp. NIES-3709]|nr:hypothetical protein GM3709_56 [Geminocystis sp. NIES-3709]